MCNYIVSHPQTLKLSKYQYLYLYITIIQGDRHRFSLNPLRTLVVANTASFHYQADKNLHLLTIIYIRASKYSSSACLMSFISSPVFTFSKGIDAVLQNNPSYCNSQAG